MATWHMYQYEGETFPVIVRPITTEDLKFLVEKFNVCGSNGRDRLKISAATTLNSFGTHFLLRLVEVAPYAEFLGLTEQNAKLPEIPFIGFSLDPENPKSYELIQAFLCCPRKKEGSRLLPADPTPIGHGSPLTTPMSLNQEPPSFQTRVSPSPAPPFIPIAPSFQTRVSIRSAPLPMPSSLNPTESGTGGETKGNCLLDKARKLPSPVPPPTVTAVIEEDVKNKFKSSDNEDARTTGGSGPTANSRGTSSLGGHFGGGLRTVAARRTCPSVREDFQPPRPPDKNRHFSCFQDIPTMDGTNRMRSDGICRPFLPSGRSDNNAEGHRGGIDEAGRIAIHYRSQVPSGFSNWGCPSVATAA